MINLETKYLEIIRSILSKHVPDCEVWVFGSRVRGRAGTYSDIDLALIGKGKIDPHRLEALRDDFSESDLPFMADVLDWHDISDSFRQAILEQYEVLMSATAPLGEGDLSRIL